MSMPNESPDLRLAEFVAALALAQDNAVGQPLESQLRARATTGGFVPTPPTFAAACWRPPTPMSA